MMGRMGARRSFGFGGGDGRGSGKFLCHCGLSEATFLRIIESTLKKNIKPLGSPASLSPPISSTSASISAPLSHRPPLKPQPDFPIGDVPREPPVAIVEWLISRERVQTPNLVHL